MKKKLKTGGSNFLPSYFSESVSVIDFDYLRSQGITVCLFDLDHTILHHGTKIIQPQILEHIHASGMKIFIATNRIHSEILDDIAKQLKADGVVHAVKGKFAKPRRQYYQQAIRLAQQEPHNIVMIGDRIIQDIWGANRSGINTILLSKFGPIKWWDRILIIPDLLLPILFKRKYRDL